VPQPLVRIRPRQSASALTHRRNDSGSTILDNAATAAVSDAQVSAAIVHGSGVALFHFCIIELKPDGQNVARRTGEGKIIFSSA